jgi:glutathione peroxidase
VAESLYDIPLRTITGQPTSLAAYRGKVLLAVNVASKCGLTPQYEALEALYREKAPDGLEILGFPANNFGAQEPGSDQEIRDFCSTSYDVHFPLFSKISVKGQDQHPLYRLLTQAQPTAVGEGPMRARLAGYGIESGGPAEVTWNFEKFLISRDGRVVQRFAPDIAPGDERIRAALELELAKPAR